MISKAYEKADFEIVEFSLEDVLTNSSVITTAPTEPGTTLPGATVAESGNGQVTVPWSDFFQ